MEEVTAGGKKLRSGELRVCSVFSGVGRTL